MADTDGPPPHADEHRDDHAVTSSATPRALFARLTTFEALLLASGFGIYLLVLSELSGFLGPPLMALAAVILLWPLRRHTAVKALLFSTAFVLTLWFVSQVSGILVPFALVYLLAYLFDPAVTWARERWGVPRWASSLVVVALVLGVVTLFMLLLVPNIVAEVRALTSLIISHADDLPGWLAEAPGFHALERAGLLNAQEAADQVTLFIEQRAAELTQSLPDLLPDLFRSIGSIFAIITIASILPVALFYTLKDYHAIQPRLVELFPTFGGKRDYLIRAGSIVGDYLRGQLIISAIAAFNVSVALVLLDVPFALLLGLLTGVLNMIPNLGAVITNVIGIAVALLFGDPALLTALKVMLVLLGQALLESSVLTPNILSHSVGLHPVLILLALFIFGSFLGIFGLFIAVPATALIMTVYKQYREEWVDVSSLAHRDQVSEMAARAEEHAEEQAFDEETP